MVTTKCNRFKGEIENYLRNGQKHFDSKINDAFNSLKFKTWLSRCNIIKKDGYPASHLLFILFLLPVLKLKTVNSFCNKQWYQWSASGKDAFYRFKQKPYRWRSFLYKIILEIFTQLKVDKTNLHESYFIIDDSVLSKCGKYIENISFIYDHCLGRSVLGFSLVTLGFLNGNGFYPLDFSYWFSAKRHDKSRAEVIGNQRSISGRMSHEAKHLSKLDLAVKMIQTAYEHGIKAGYVLFDSWYAWPSVIHKIRLISQGLHVICRLKDSKTLYEYKGKKYRLSELYQKVKRQLHKCSRTGLLLKRVTVTLPGSPDQMIIVFAKGYCEPEDDTVKGKKKSKEPQWVAFLSTDTRLQASTVIKKYTKRWAIEVFFKESKQLLGLGKEQSNSFQAQVFSATTSFIRYNLLSYLNVQENHNGFGTLFEDLADESAVITYGQKLWLFFRGLFKVSFSKIFELFKIEDDFQSYLDALEHAIYDSTPILGCET